MTKVQNHQRIEQCKCFHI